MANPPSSVSGPDLICLSHLRWHFVFQRPQHVMTRCGRERRVFFVEEPIFRDNQTPELALDHDRGVVVATPQLATGLSSEEIISAQRSLLDELVERYAIRQFVLWYYTPMA
jgi:UDP-galactopyranose mutase